MRYTEAVTVAESLAQANQKDYIIFKYTTDFGVRYGVTDLREGGAGYLPHGAKSIQTVTAMEIARDVLPLAGSVTS